jgi:hypothetical protein
MGIATGKEKWGGGHTIFLMSIMKNKTDEDYCSGISISR